MLEALQAQNDHLRRRLESLLRQARSNEEKLRRFERLEHALIGAGSLPDLLRVILLDYRETFELDAVGLCLLDAGGDLQRCLDEAGVDRAAAFPGLQLLGTASEQPLLLQLGLRPVLGQFQAWRHACLFGPDRGAGLASCAVLPLVRQGQLIGSLQFASRDSGRYEADAGTEFLERLAAIVAICLDNVLNQERLRQAGITDALTGLHNRRYFEQRCPIEVGEAQRHGHGLACLFLDVDHFKRINDTHGHPVGDEVLRQVGQRIRQQLRAGDTMARYGGEEFVVLLPRCPDEHALETAERIRRALCETCVELPDGTQLPVTLSAGLSLLSHLLTSSQLPLLAGSLVAAADAALYAAKAQGRNRIVMGGQGAGPGA
ncbi:DUF484 family protein [Pelomonas sp. APW6]|uniref:diguanylate cyclase n=1 Tax=Roseateles subflavus TaxID=3053353 RepID=A0ABT7LJI5_9BURK|nr:DUF484 family protein [Pelomonas sp. APW6]MDL5033021.1 DUF484 family protein [Pelomonas sp. APW6]